MTDFSDAAHRSRVLSAADELAAMLDTLPAIEGSDWAASHRRYREAVTVLSRELTTRQDNPARISEGYSDVYISLLGFRASGASGFAAACRNWIAQVRKKADAWKAHQ
ncbi:hypothetical protein [Pseudooceanicola algae]|uniref:Uncharacterized protein n=1 Tax=Pseudooceanicola algae TaxID=1537215 RepID=A0A418SK73_9RHOB|nr:hypothetical protein [Pseudooceanicola algae]QPM89130.1 hypothetical protein PSAL_003410 [Pseudooceanicola algae]